MWGLGFQFMNLGECSSVHNTGYHSYMCAEGAKVLQAVYVPGTLCSFHIRTVYNLGASRTVSKASTPLSLSPASVIQSITDSLGYLRACHQACLGSPSLMARVVPLHQASERTLRASGVRAQGSWVKLYLAKAFLMMPGEMTALWWHASLPVLSLPSLVKEAYCLVSSHDFIFPGVKTMLYLPNPCLLLSSLMLCCSKDASNPIAGAPPGTQS